ncbi:unnamed protein product [Echinostoma caproni]|uniref:hydroxyacylglutathione hydrolase n=1 Tax=Echinostoma caproni TaxID=27848 RepID=A0A183BGJ3_9TREM|nr:unnamed protein product [Echinostoma caproni]
MHFSKFLRAMEVITLNALSDNYMYLLIDKTTKKCAAVDPVNPKRILDAVKENGVHLSAILTTHHHSDHAGGNAELVHQWSSLHGEKLNVYGGDKRVDAITDAVAHEQKLKIGDNLDILCLSTPCHTSGHVCYYVVDRSNPSDTAVFTGDTLFLGGCGRFFEVCFSCCLYSHILPCFFVCEETYEPHPHLFGCGSGHRLDWALRCIGHLGRLTPSEGRMIR